MTETTTYLDDAQMGQFVYEFHQRSDQRKR